MRVMELETNTPISDEARLLAQSKKLTLQPVHAEVSAEDLPDSVIVGQHLARGAMANIAMDTEQNAASIIPLDEAISPMPGDKKDQVRLYILTGVGFLLFATIATIVIIQL